MTRSARSSRRLPGWSWHGHKSIVAPGSWVPGSKVDIITPTGTLFGVMPEAADWRMPWDHPERIHYWRVHVDPPYTENYRIDMAYGQIIDLTKP